MPRTINLLPVEIDIQLEQETDALIDFVLKTYNMTTQQWEPANISNDQVRFTARADFGGAITIDTKTILPSQHPDGVNGVTRVKLTKTDLTTGDRAVDEIWRYEIRRVIGGTGGDEVVYIKGRLLLAKTVGIN